MAENNGEVGKVKKLHPGSANLIPFSQRSEEEQRAIRSAGGKKSGEKRREKRTLKEHVKWLTDDPDTQAGIGSRMVRIVLTGRDADAIKAFNAIVGYIDPPKSQIEIGNIDDRPLATVDVSKLSDDQLRAMLARRQAEDAAEDACEND